MRLQCHITRMMLTAVAATAMMLAGCTVHPAGERQQLQAARRLGEAYKAPFAHRRQPPLPAAATPRELVAWGLRNNPAVEAAYWNWVQALDYVPQAGTQATAPMLNAGAAINSGSVSAAGTTLGLSNMTGADIQWPGKLDAQARAALARAGAAEEVFLQRRFAARRDILLAYNRWAWRVASDELLLQTHTLIKAMRAFAVADVQVGQMNTDELLKTQERLAQHRILMAQLAYACREDRYKLNEVLGRDVHAPMHRPAAIAVPRLGVLSIRTLVTLALKHNAALHGLNKQIAAARQDLLRAKMHYIPNFDAGAATSLDGLMQNVSGALVLPWIKYEAFNAAIAQARAEIAAASAELRSQQLDIGTRLAVDVQMIRSDQAQLRLFEHSVLPRLNEMLLLVRARYQTGSGSAADQLNIQMSQLDTRQAMLDLQRQIADRVADLDAIVDGKVER